MNPTDYMAYGPPKTMGGSANMPPMDQNSYQNVPLGPSMQQQEPKFPPSNFAAPPSNLRPPMNQLPPSQKPPLNGPNQFGFQNGANMPPTVSPAQNNQPNIGSMPPTQNPPNLRGPGDFPNQPMQEQFSKGGMQGPPPQRVNPNLQMQNNTQMPPMSSSTQFGTFGNTGPSSDKVSQPDGLAKASQNFPSQMPPAKSSGVAQEEQVNNASNVSGSGRTASPQGFNSPPPINSPSSQNSHFVPQNVSSPVSTQIAGLPSGQNLPPMPGPGRTVPAPSGQNMPPMQGQNMPPMSGQNMPPMSGQNMPSMQQPMVGQNSAPPMPPMSAQGIPPMSGGHNMPPPPVGPSNVMQPLARPAGPPMAGGNIGQNMPPPPMPGQNMPPLPGHPTATTPGQRMPPAAGQNMPPLSGQNRPPMQNQNMPPLPGQHQQQQQQQQNQRYSMQNLPPIQPPMSGQFSNFGKQPSQYQQLPQQMQNVNLSGPYPPSGRPPVNGDGHVQQYQDPRTGYINGQQPARPGYPPMAGNQYENTYSQHPQPVQQQRTLHPDQIPNPIQVMMDDQLNPSGVFYSNQKGLVPPLVSTKFVVQDQGYASPRFLRSTIYTVPITNDLIKQCAVPFGLIISPMARIVDGEYPPPVADFGELGPVRCVRCKAYMCPHMQFIDSGRRFQCLFCKATTDVPQEYFQHLDPTGQRMDRYQRPELVLGTYELTATKDYCRNNTFPKPPAMIFVIDVSYNNIKSGLVHLICSQMKEIIKNLPVDEGQKTSNMRVGFITYNSSVHFYNIKGSLAAPQMLVVGDVNEMFMPLLDGFLCTPEESDTVIDALMEQIPAMFAETRECETILLPAITAGMEALKASDTTGKLLVFHSTLPTAEAPGKLKMRDDRKLLGTEKERTVLTPQIQAYNQLGQECVGVGCSVDLFLFNNAYIDIATIGQVCRLTGGEVFKYTYFQADIDGQRLINDVITNISRPIAFDAIMRVRTSTGVRPTDFYGHCYMSNTTDIELASIDCDKALAVEIKHDDKLQDDEGIYIQVALLYTSVSGQRRLRIINQVLKTTSKMEQLYRACDLETIMNFMSKQATYKILDNNPKAVKEGIVQRSAQILAYYRKNYATPSSVGQLVLPESMKLLPLYVNCLLKSDALSGGPDITIDERSYIMQAVMTMDVPSSVNYFYPKLIPLHELNVTDDKPVEPQQIRCTISKMNEQGVYLLENGMHMFLWIGLGASQDFVQKVFGVPSAVQINIEVSALPELNNALSIAVRNIIEKIRSQKHRYMKLTIVRQREKLESVFKHFLVEDNGLDGSHGYIDFLCHMHKEIRNILS